MTDIFDVIADGTRRDILQLLRERAASSESGTSVSHIVNALGVSQPTVSKHLKVLREAGLVSVREEGQHRFYSLETAPLDEVDDWLMPFYDDGFAAAEEVSSATLPDSAAAAADLVGRAAASTKHALDSVLKRIPGR
ncbi:MAG: metalloregulator ArsR/SmtB family transcription factor [Microbacterium sp.]